MELEAAMAQIGAEVVKTEEKGTTFRVWCRIPTKGSVWSTVLREVLSRSGAEWSVDVSKSYFVKDGSIRFLWRLIFSGDVGAATAAVVQCLDRSQGEREVTSMPLVGRVEYEFDPARGKTKGAHNAKDNVAAVVIGGAQ